MKKYTLINNKTNNVTRYTSLMWELAWILVFIAGIGTGILIAIIGYNYI